LDNLDLDLLKFMSERENNIGYGATITKNLCTKEAWTLLEDMGKYFHQHGEATVIDDDFKLWMRVTRHPGWKQEEHQIYGTIVDNALKRPPPSRPTFMAEVERTRYTTQCAGAYAKLRDGDITPADHDALITKYSGQVARSAKSTVDVYDIEDIAKFQRANQGFFFRLEDLNKSIGPLRKGDFVVIAKRPEVGGTSFLCSELTYMVDQMADGGNAIMFHNEEEPSKIHARFMTSALGIDYKTLMDAPAKYKTDYDKWLGTRSLELKHDTGMSLGSIHTKLKEREYGLIGINVLLKVGGTGQKEDHDKFQALGEECRRISQQYGPVLAIVQADPSAEGMRYIPQDRIYKSKTALQGEADALIMLGKDHDVPDNLRYISVAKNKIPPAPCTDLTLKHIKSEVHFDIGTGLFTSLNFNKNSRNKKS